MSKKNTPSAVRVKQPEPPAEPIATEIIATSIVEISAAMKKIRDGRLNDRAIILLIQEACGGRNAIAKETVNTVLDAIENLEATYTKKSAK
jgi:hypothetical protein